MTLLAAGPSALPAESTCLIVLDGWGLAEPGPGNAVSLADTPVFDELWETYPHTRLTACGRAVGLPEGQVGNSEVGHLNLGAGSIVHQIRTVIDDAVADGSLAANEVLRDAFDAPRIHLIGLVSDGGVHAAVGHLQALIGMGAGREVIVHAFTDGRDAPPTAAAAELDALERGGVRIGSVIGRYFAMDRDGRWDRTQLAYDLLVHGRAPHRAASAAEAGRAAYDRGETDEFIAPTVIGEPTPIAPGDSVVCFNFRPDRMRQLTRALAMADDVPIDRGGAGPVDRYATLTEYEEGWPFPVAYHAVRPALTIAAVIAAGGARQLHVAETEKYPHVTYFFNGGDERPPAGERRELVPSPRDVPTYDHKPQMSAPGVTAAFLEAWREERPQFAVINFANADMVGHTGVIPAAVTAVETVDACLGEVVAAVHEGGGVCIVTADHGNADHMLEDDGSPNTAHSMNQVPLIVTSPARDLRDGGILADVAPTALELIGVAVPAEMTGESLLA
ncbi:MAG: 2,3-bisphosphoglycerate-independent phosphoglycerate mutase [Solirubrobacteraceae bacterium]